MNRKTPILLRILAVIMLLAGIVILAKDIAGEHDSRTLGYALVLINFGNVFNILAIRQDKEDKSNLYSKIVTICVVVLAVTLVVMVTALILG